MTNTNVYKKFDVDEIRALREYNSLRHFAMDNDEIKKEYDDARKSFLSLVDALKTKSA